MACKVLTLRDVGASVLIIGLSLVSATVAKADDPVPPPNSPARAHPRIGPHRSISLEEAEIFKKRQLEREAEYNARPKPPPAPTGIISDCCLDEMFGSSHLIENGWHDIVNGHDIWVYAGSMRFDPTSGGAVRYDPLTAHGFAIIEIGKRGTPSFKGERIYTPTAVGSLRVIAAQSPLLTLQSRQGYRFLLNVETAQLTAM
jgi:hypothetical protein